MQDTDSSKPRTPASHARFATTHWTVVLAAGSPDSSRYREALETLCQIYWYPLYAYLRRRGYNTHQAEDYTQGFLTRLLERQSLKRADPTQGRFRSFLLSSLKHFIADEWDHAQAKKRGGDKRVFSLDVADAETRYSWEPAHTLSPEKLFEKSWALTILQQAIVQLKTECAEAGKLILFEHLKSYLQADDVPPPYEEMAPKLGMSKAAVRTTVHRLRQRYRELVRREIAQTVVSPDQVDDEIRHLFTVLTS